MDTSKYIVGLDLGTTHCVLTFTEADHDAHEAPTIHRFDIPQVVNPGDIRAWALTMSARRPG